MLFRSIVQVNGIVFVCCKDAYYMVLCAPNFGPNKFQHIRVSVCARAARKEIISRMGARASAADDGGGQIDLARSSCVAIMLHQNGESHHRMMCAQMTRTILAHARIELYAHMRRIIPAHD